MGKRSLNSSGSKQRKMAGCFGYSNKACVP